jgi:hypothetical protein
MEPGPEDGTVEPGREEGIIEHRLEEGTMEPGADSSTYCCSRNWLEVSGQLHALAVLSPPGERTTGTHWMGGQKAPEQVWTTWRGEKSCVYRDSNLNPWGVQPLA